MIFSTFVASVYETYAMCMKLYGKNGGLSGKTQIQTVIKPFLNLINLEFFAFNINLAADSIALLS